MLSKCHKISVFAKVILLQSDNNEVQIYTEKSFVYQAAIKQTATKLTHLAEHDGWHKSKSLPTDEHQNKYIQNFATAQHAFQLVCKKHYICRICGNESK